MLDKIANMIYNFWVDKDAAKKLLFIALLLIIFVIMNFFGKEDFIIEQTKLVL